MVVPLEGCWFESSLSLSSRRRTTRERLSARQDGDPRGRVASAALPCQSATDAVTVGMTAVARIQSAEPIQQAGANGPLWNLVRRCGQAE
jgi:hypothetical protein